jgi:hypothetical protein
MDIYDLKGRVISKEKVPIAKLQIEAFDEDPIFDTDDLLGTSATDSEGLFSIQFDKSKFDDIWETLDGTPDVFLLVRDKKGRQLIKTKEAKTKREIQYHIRHDPSNPNPEAPDPYSGNARRMLNMLGEVGDLINKEYRINLDLLNRGDLPEEIRKDINEFVGGHVDRRYNHDQFIVVLQSLVDTLAEVTRVGSIGYDGPQVPRLPKREPYDQVIVWPRQEKFKWG